jgi:hypothetical protein
MIDRPVLVPLKDTIAAARGRCKTPRLSMAGCPSAPGARAMTLDDTYTATATPFATTAKVPETQPLALQSTEDSWQKHFFEARGEATREIRPGRLTDRRP